MILLLSLLTITTLCGWGYALYLRHRLALIQQKNQQHTHWQTEQHKQQEKLSALQQTYLNAQQQHAFALQDHLTRNMSDIREQLNTTLKQHAASFDNPLKRLTDTVEKRLESISQQVTQRLEVGFDKTTALFTDVVKRLAHIDEAQKRNLETKQVHHAFIASAADGARKHSLQMQRKGQSLPKSLINKSKLIPPDS